MSEKPKGDPAIEAIIDGLLHLPVKGAALRLAAHQVRLELQKAGFEIRPTKPPH